MKKKLYIVLSGPESCGKTTLTKALATHYGEGYSLEYAREYLKNRPAEHTLNDIKEIGVGQRAYINVNCLKAKKVALADTDESVLMIWALFVYSQRIMTIEDNFDTYIPDLYLLLSPDIPWEYDPLRSNANNRDEIFELYEDLYKNNDRPYLVIKGSHEDRLKQAINAIDNLLKQ
jgi:HTH-type transcriptional regulator, transcriptional repressor of NAD biosynthesis genes